METRVQANTIKAAVASATLVAVELVCPGYTKEGPCGWHRLSACVSQLHVRVHEPLYIQSPFSHIATDPATTLLRRANQIKQINAQSLPVNAIWSDSLTVCWLTKDGPPADRPLSLTHV